MTAGLAAGVLVGRGGFAANGGETPDVVLARGGDMEARLSAVLRPFGGLAAFVKKGDRAVIKPNAAFAETPEAGGNTTPELITALVRACWQAGVASVTLVEHCLSNHELFGTDDDPSGITQAAKAAGASILATRGVPEAYRPIRVGAPGMDEMPVTAAILDADVVINLPRLKSHPGTGYTVSMKNLMGAVANPGAMHEGGVEPLCQRIACLAHGLQPHISLNIVDATHVVRDWAAGRPATLTRADTLIAGVNMVSVDAVGVTLFDDDPLGHWICGWNGNPIQEQYIAYAHRMGWGPADLSSVRLLRVDV
ncbi:MAG: DUF362 domain-containing protein [Armatimonadetes bacterium]|nr:DUF362 domain-containing protein [Armatimonadota bacterium]